MKQTSLVQQNERHNPMELEIFKNFQSSKDGTIRYTIDALQLTDGRSKRKKELSFDREVGKASLFNFWVFYFSILINP